MMDEKELNDIAQEALQDFWERVAKMLSQVKRGDLTPVTSQRLETVAKEAILEWYEMNK
jgi:hypothetical protein